jgi:tRNA(Ile2) C34 agmatinyltransferase TiaS|tara:strand:+ start:165 stop:395 length:231 start_codon:yes stop_codon:yes gene_type:complete
MSNNFFTKGSPLKAEVTNGKCPTCQQYTMLVSLTRDFYRCITCGSDLEQKINGIIKYIPLNVKPYVPENKPEIKNG